MTVELFKRDGAELIRVVSIDAAAGISDTNALILVDEADKIFVWDKSRPPKKCKACIGLTATVPDSEGRSYIRKRL